MKNILSALLALACAPSAFGASVPVFIQCNTDATSPILNGQWQSPGYSDCRAQTPAPNNPVVPLLQCGSQVTLSFNGANYVMPGWSALEIPGSPGSVGFARYASYDYNGSEDFYFVLTDQANAQIGVMVGVSADGQKLIPQAFYLLDANGRQNGTFCTIGE